MTDNIQLIGWCLLAWVLLNLMLVGAWTLLCAVFHREPAAPPVALDTWDWPVSPEHFAQARRTRG